MHSQKIMKESRPTQKVFVPLNQDTTVLDEAVQGLPYQISPSEAAPISNRPKKTAFIETYGCAMNFSDTEIIASVLRADGYEFTNDENLADLVLLNTCAIRDNAEEKVWNRLKSLRKVKKSRPGSLVGVMGCMAERLKETLLEKEKLVDLIVGPDSYRDIPNLVAEAETGQKAVNVFLSKDETYDGISPIRLNSNGITAFITITRGCDNMCSFCVVPFTRGRERSRDWKSIVKEAEELVADGYKEVTLLGQNVDSYDFEDCTFAQLLEKVALVSPDLRVRFSTSHPKDITDEVLFVIAKYPNICKNIHLPVQSGSSRILDLMRRGYTREWYLNKINRINEIIPGCGLSTDIITGFCSETEEDHAATMSLIPLVEYHTAYMFFYSERPGTLAARKYADDIPEALKRSRLAEVIALQNSLQKERNNNLAGKVYSILIEGLSRKSELDFCGRNDKNQMVIFPAKEGLKAGMYVNVRIKEATSMTLKGEIVK